MRPVLLYRADEAESRGGVRGATASTLSDQTEPGEILLENVAT